MLRTYIIVEDHPLIAKAIHSALDPLAYQMIGKFIEQKECIKFLDTHNPEIAFLDIRLGQEANTFEILKKLSLTNTCQIALYTSYPCPWLFIRLHRLGIKPKVIIDKKEIPDWTRIAEHLVNEIVYYSDTVVTADILFRDSMEMKEIANLSDRNWEFLFEFAKGKTDKEIAAYKNISQSTVNDYRKKIYAILNPKGVGGLISILRDWGYYDLEI